MSNPVLSEEEETMTIILYAQPYDISAEGFYFSGTEEYDKQSANLKNQYGDPVEEFEIQFIDGDLIDCDLAKAWGLNQANVSQYFRVVEEWDKEDKIRFILAVGECGCGFDPDTVSLTDYDVDVYCLNSMHDLAIELVDDGYFGDMPENLCCYLDYDAIALDLVHEGYSKAIVAGERLIYRCG